MEVSPPAEVDREWLSWPLNRGRGSAEQFQERHHVRLILFREDEARGAWAVQEEEGVKLCDVLERLRGVVVKVRSRLPDTPERQDLEEVREERPRRRRHPGRRARG